MTAPAERRCPSALCQPGNQLLGVQTDAGLARILPPPVIDEAFVAAAEEAGAPERRFRFAGRCLASGCNQWRDGGCSIGRDAAARGPAERRSAPLPPCHIRPTCRWYTQEGGDACRACGFAVTDPTGLGAPH